MLTRRHLCRSLAGAAALLPLSRSVPAAAQLAPGRHGTLLIAHRGASAYAPENTIPAFQLGIEQGADYVEYDLHFTRDGKLVCLHDETLERTTNVEQVFPARFREVTRNDLKTRRWFVYDFTLDEIGRLDAGSWMDQKFAGTRIPTHQEAIDSIRGHAGLFIELKMPERYAETGFDMEAEVLADLKRSGLSQPGADPKTPVLIQSFSAASIQKLAWRLKTKLTLHLLIGERDAERWVSPEGLKNVRKFATGIGPDKQILLKNPQSMRWAREAGLKVTPYTFRSTAVDGFPDVRAEMEHYIRTFGVDGVITDNPDQLPNLPAAGQRGGAVPTAAGRSARA
jgi:glycerophosphoryl diester phosphodiesterase